MQEEGKGANSSWPMATRLGGYGGARRAFGYTAAPSSRFRGHWQRSISTFKSGFQRTSSSWGTLNALLRAHLRRPPRWATRCRKEQGFGAQGEGARSGRPGGGSVRAKGTGGRSAGESGGRSEMGMGATESPREEGNAWRLGLGECEFGSGTMGVRNPAKRPPKAPAQGKGRRPAGGVWGEGGVWQKPQR